MKKNKQKDLIFSICMLASFILWTAAIQITDKQAIGPQESSVGFATINMFVNKLTGVNMFLYNITDWLSLVPIVFAFGFATFGLIQLIQRKHILKVDFNILALGVFYIVVMAVYILFEAFVVNYRPVLIDGILEASYPSSTTMLVLCIMPTTIIQLDFRLKNIILKRCIAYTIIVFIVFMVLGRLISGVHWFTDIIGGALLSAGLVLMYRAICFYNK